ncbi:putative methylase [Klebsiella pneumoniae subsp. ozaenae]|uniref:Putative methylase n=1 Tax=Klebsiella pneumoniae subsp. ozaenae TaxID=574 RepID=A0A378UEW6_KLEPO|nr:putative methylase [Klebsiella pneumoniae subsp. ozaenae]
MSRLILGDCVQVMTGIPEKAVDFILTDPPYLVGFRDRQGRTIAGDKRMNGCNLPVMKCTAY